MSPSPAIHFAVVDSMNDKVQYKTNRRPFQIKNRPACSQAQIERREHEESSVRAKAEHVFDVVKGLFALANLYSADKCGLLV
jgi:hypothetical protein